MHLSLEASTVPYHGLVVLRDGFCGLSEVADLQFLDASFNRITTLGSHLRGLSQLHTLRIASNRLRTLSGLHHASGVVELHAPGNRIEELGRGLRDSLKLQRVNLASNRVRDLSEVFHLALLPELVELHMADLDFNTSPNPVCKMKNFETFCIFHLPHLQIFNKTRLDAKIVQVVCQIYTRKQLYYTTRLRLLRRRFVAATTEANRLHEANWKAKKSLLREVQDQVLSQSPVSVLSTKQRLKAQSVKIVEEALRESLVVKHMVVDRMDELKQRAERSLLWEHESAGNVFLERGTPSHDWYKDVVQLISSRFHLKEFHPLSLKGVQVKAVTKIHNRLLELRFNEHHGRLVEGGGARSEVLFYGVDPAAPQEVHCSFFKTEMSSAGAREVLRANEEWNLFTEDGCVTAEGMDWVFEKDAMLFPPGELLICRAIIHEPTLSCLMVDDDHVCGPSVLWQKKPIDSLVSYTDATEEDDDEDEDGIRRKTPPQAHRSTASYRYREGRPHDKYWWILSPDVVLPLYHVVIEYVTEKRSFGLPWSGRLLHSEMRDAERLDSRSSAAAQSPPWSSADTPSRRGPLGPAACSADGCAEEHVTVGEFLEILKSQNSLSQRLSQTEPSAFGNRPAYRTQRPPLGGRGVLDDETLWGPDGEELRRLLNVNSPNDFRSMTAITLPDAGLLAIEPSFLQRACELRVRTRSREHRRVKNEPVLILFLPILLMRFSVFL
uniref:Cell wall surface anchor family protein, related n=1 Tax=Neospora caninum (strain Liverpool) TaxID=572307 RepID=A0A0F7UAF5_NEOCL|nr:TPA: Cell wall surface anchor family protein, related [Neospora caninum Liverpool]